MKACGIGSNLRRRVLTVASSLTLLLATAHAAGAGAGASIPAATLPGWLAGHWCLQQEDVVVEELWLPATGDALLGISRTVKAGQTLGFEFLRVATVDGVITYLAQPGGRPPTAFARTEAGDNWIRFENLQHDYPQRIEYRREGDRLNAAITGPGKDGKAKTIPFAYRRCSG